jgi:hypothetical protein
MNVRRGQLQITSSGFQFLLHTPHSQLWELLLQYLQMVEVRVPFLILSRRHSTNRSHPGKANGSGGSTQLFVHAIDNGAWTGKDFPSALF